MGKATTPATPAIPYSAPPVRKIQRGTVATEKAVSHGYYLGAQYPIVLPDPKGTLAIGDTVLVTSRGGFTKYRKDGSSYLTEAVTKGQTIGGIDGYRMIDGVQHAVCWTEETIAALGIEYPEPKVQGVPVVRRQPSNAASAK